MDRPPEEEEEEEEEEGEEEDSGSDSNYEDDEDDGDDDDDDDYDDDYDDHDDPIEDVDDQADDDLVDAILQRGEEEEGGGAAAAAAQGARARAEARLPANAVNRRVRAVPGENGLLRRTASLLVNLGCHHRVLILFIFDGILNKSFLRFLGVPPDDVGFGAHVALFIMFVVNLLLFLVPINSVFEFLRILGGGYIPLFAAFSINFTYVQSLLHQNRSPFDDDEDSSSPDDASESSPSSSPSYSIVLVLLSALHLDLTMIDLNRESDSLIMDEFDADYPDLATFFTSSSPRRRQQRPAAHPAAVASLSLRTRVTRALWLLLRLSCLVSLVSPFLIANSLLPFVPLENSHFFPAFWVPFVAVTVVLAKRLPSYWRQSAKALKRLYNVVARNVRNFGAPGIIYFLEDHWIRLRLPRVLRAFFGMRILCQCVDMFIFTGKDPEKGYPTIPSSNVLVMFPRSFYSIHDSPEAAAVDVVVNNISSFPNVSTPFLGAGNSFLSLVVPSRQTCPVSTPFPATPSSIAFSPLLILLVGSADTCVALLGFSSWIAQVTYHVGHGIQGFLGLEDDPEREEGGNMGAVGSILFFILGVQTGLTGMEPEKRLVRLYKNFSLLVVALLHYVHSLVHPQLESLSLPASRYTRTFVVCAILVWFPLGFIVFLWSRFSPSTWLLAVTVFGLELIIKVVLSLFIFVLFKIDASTDEVWEPLDDYIYWVRAVSSSVEFLFAVFLFCNGFWIMLFESGGTIRAVMMCIHAYCNIWQQARLGWEEYKKRRQSVVKIDSMLDATEAQLARHQDVCSICYNDLTTAKVTVCHHFFHASCLKKWLYLQDNCPMCHRNIFADDDVDDDGRVPTAAAVAEEQ